MGRVDIQCLIALDGKQVKFLDEQSTTWLDIQCPITLDGLSMMALDDHSVIALTGRE